MSFFPSITSDDKYIRTGAIDQLFTLTARGFTIYKEPIKNIISEPTNPLYGYGDSQSNNEQITYAPVYQSYSGRIIYPQKNQGSSKSLFEGKVNLDPNSTYIKMRPEAFEYLNNGNKTEKIIADNTSWNYTKVFQVQNYLGLQFYYCQIEGVN